MILHGLADTVVLPVQARRFDSAMRKSGNRCDLLLVEGAGHAFVLAGYTAPETVVVEAMRAIDRFLVDLGYLTGEATLVASPSNRQS